MLAEKMDDITVKVFTQGRLVPSSRFRIMQLKSLLESKGILFEVSHAHVSAYPPKGYFNRIIWIFKELFFRAKSVFFTNEVDISIFQREMISTLYTFERFIKGHKILDVDDAVWLRRNEMAINKIAYNVQTIVCGNKYLTNYFNKFNKPISVIPTGVDTIRFKPIKKRDKVIGWSGGSSAFCYLYAIESEIAQVLNQNPHWKLRIVADLPPHFTLISNEQLEFIKWSEDIEVQSISSMSIGLMPLDDSPWSKGKCSYKMLLYMACGLPVVVSNVGMNTEILEMARVGIGVDDDSNWCQNINQLILDKKMRHAMGNAGREVVVKNFSLDVIANKWEKVIKDTLALK